MASSWARLFALGRKSRASPLVDVVDLEGVIASGGGSAAALRRGISLTRVESWLTKAFSKTLQPAAVAININSPGGSAVQSDLIHRRIRSLSEESQIPVYTYAQDYAASELLQRLGLERRVQTAGKDKVLMDPFRPETEEGKAKLQQLLDDLHLSFKDLVRQSRGQALKGTEDELFSGQAWTGHRAKSLGLIDGIEDMRSHLCGKFGPQTVFRLCSERPRSPLFGRSFPVQQLSSAWPGSYDICREASSALLDELNERAMKARLGI